MHTVYVALGSNVGDRQANLKEAISQLAPKVTVTAESAIYETEPWGFEDQDDFLNMVVQGETELSPLELLTHLKEIEANVGRTKTFRNGPREIDLDILFYDELIFEDEALAIPHPRLHERAFVLTPLADIAPKFVHPIWNQRVAELLANIEQKDIHSYYQSKILNPKEPIVGIGDLTVKDYWAWAYSDLLSNTNRAVLAEFIVGALLNTVNKPRIEWDGYDFTYQNKKIEVKSSAYLQSWKQKEHSKIVFDIARKKSWDAKKNEYDEIATRPADCYIFCVHKEKHIAKANPLALDQWDFYALSKKHIEKQFENQKSVSLSVIQKHTSKTKFTELKSIVDDILKIDE